jgi:signal transduction histidine kinase
VIGLSILDFIHPNYHDKAISSWNNVVPNQVIKNEDMTMIRKDGSKINVNLKQTGLKDDKLDRNTNVWIIEESSKYNTKEKPKMDRCTNAEVYLDILNHDIEKLTRAITTYSELLLMKPDLPEQFRKYFESTLNNSKSIIDLIANIRNLSHLENNTFEIKNVDVFKMLAEAIDIVQQNNPNREIKINQSISESEVIVRSNDLLVFAFVNIISNAIKFENGRDLVIDISHSPYDNGAYWKLEFKDNGPGVPNDLKERIFCDFEVGSQYKHGSGLGLAVVKGIIERSGGKVWVEDNIINDQLKGSNFVILIPKTENMD